MAVVVGLDPGMSHFGAVALRVPENLVIGADAWTSETLAVPRPRKLKPGQDPPKKDPRRTLSITEDYARRSALAAQWLSGLLRYWSPDLVAAEGTAGVGGRKGGQPNQAAIFTIWGATIGAVTIATPAPFVPVHQASWKRHVVPHGLKVTDERIYDSLYHTALGRIDGYLRERGRAASLSVHAMDALGVALCAAANHWRAGW